MTFKKSAALVLSVILLLMSAALFFMGWRFVASGYALFIGIGIGLGILGLVALWYLGNELYMAWNVEKLTNAAAEIGQMPGFEVADLEGFERVRDRVRQNPEDWVGWVNIGYAYANVGDKRNGRRAFLKAIRLYKKSTAAS